MNIGDVEYTITGSRTLTANLVSEREEINFAVGIKVRALLVRATVAMDIASVVNFQAGIYLENGTSLAEGVNANALFNEVRLIPLIHRSARIATSGVFDLQGPKETLHWKILQPQISIHFVGPLAADDFRWTLAYRFAELTDNEIVEIAAQRSIGYSETTSGASEVAVYKRKGPFRLLGA